MRIAVLADVHANAHALDAVLAEVERARVDTIVCLGDLVGYNGEPAAVVARIRAVAGVVVAGNHDREVASEVAAGTRAAARRALQRHRELLGEAERAYLAALPSHVVTARFVAAHGAYLSEVYVSGYVTSTMVEENLRAIAARPGWPSIAMCGHTHQPMIGWLTPTSLYESRVGDPEGWPPGATVLVNPGSVGQPRDGDPRAAWGLLDLDAPRFTVHRVRYDVDGAAAAIVRAGLPDELATRLREGR